MDVFDLEAFIRLNVDEYMNELGNAESETKKTGSKLSSILGGTAKAVGAGLAAAGTGVVKLGKDALDAYANYEQLVGGVETLFKNSAPVVEAYADIAYKTAGMSANEYMETVTGFSASLLQSVGNDTVKAAEIADQAIIDMSDNANKMGSDISSIQNAYSGFAKQNYTMLDNLKLGYGGTKEEMERLLADAEKFSGVKYDISSYADVINAIHVIQGELGISGRTAEEAAAIIERTGRSTDEVYEQLGTTAKEASTTIQGSLASMKSAWQNLIVGIADENQPFDDLVDNFVNSVDTVADNIMPRIEKILEGIGTLIEKLVPKLADRLPSMLEKILPGLVKAATSLINSLSKSLPEIIKILIKVLVDNISVIVDGLIELVVALVGALPEIIGPIIEALPTIIDNVVDGLMRALPQLIKGIINLAVELAAHAPEIISIILESFGPLGEGLSALFDVLSEGVLGPILETAGGLLTDLFSGIALLLTDPKEALEKFFNWFKDKAELTIKSVKDLFTGLFQLIPALFEESEAADRKAEADKRMQELVDQGVYEMDSAGNYQFTQAYKEKMGYELNTTVEHTGTIKFEGVNDEGDFVGASEYVIDQMRKEQRMGYGY